MKTKNLLTVGLVCGLLASNIITGYQFSTEYHKQEVEISKKADHIKKLTDMNSERNRTINKQQDKINTYEEENLKLNNQIKVNEEKVVSLEKQLLEAKKKAQSKESP